MVVEFGPGPYAWHMRHFPYTGLADRLLQKSRQSRVRVELPMFLLLRQRNSAEYIVT
jgi:hypothetical protein